MSNRSSLPPWLIEAVANRPANQHGPGQPNEFLIPTQGDVFVVDPVHPEDAEPRMIVVVEVLSESATVTAALATEVTEARTDRDLLVKGDSRVLPFDLVIECDIVGPVLFSQLRACVGHLDAHHTEMIREISVGSVKFRPRWLPLRGQSDPRWAFRSLEVEAMERLSRPAATFLSETSGTAIIDPLLLSPDHITTLTAVPILAALASRRAQLPLDAIDSVLQLANPSATNDGFPLRADFWNALRPYLQINRYAPLVAAGASVARCDPPRLCPPNVDPLMICVESNVRRGVVAMNVITDTSAWVKDVTIPPYCVVTLSDGGTVLVLPHNLDAAHG